MTEATKTAQSENFPVASLLLSKKVRAHVMAFYKKARAFDDIADSPTLTSQEKNRQLSVQTEDPFLDDLLQAFRQDVEKKRYQTWDELLRYCRYSANPVGRFLLDVHDEKEGHDASDALCTALQVLNHLQDCQKDFLTIDRIYLPQEFLPEGAFEDHLSRGACSSELRQVLNACLDRCDVLIATALTLPGDIKNWRLRYQAKVTILSALALSGRLRRLDPLAKRVELTKVDMFLLAYKGLFPL